LSVSSNPRRTPFVAVDRKEETMLLAAAPQLLDSPCCEVINRVPWGFFMLVHVALFLIAAFFALKMFQSDRSLFGLGFGLFAVAELSYMTYHVNATLFLFAHTISEVLVGGAVVALFAAAAKAGLVSVAATSEPQRTARVKAAGAR
jgi:hypothetical protein